MIALLGLQRLTKIEKASAHSVDPRAIRFWVTQHQAFIRELSGRPTPMHAAAVGARAAQVRRLNLEVSQPAFDVRVGATALSQAEFPQDVAYRVAVAHRDLEDLARAIPDLGSRANRD